MIILLTGATGPRTDRSLCSRNLRSTQANL